MEKNILEYKGYCTYVEYNKEAEILIGKIEGISDFINFECQDMSKMEEEYQLAVDDYLNFCEETGKHPLIN